MTRKETEFDGRTLSEKIGAGDVRAIDGGDVAAAGQTALGVAGMAKHFLPAAAVPFAQPVGAALSGVSAYYDEEETKAKISKYFDGNNIRQLVRQNPALRRKLEKEVDWLDLGGQMASSMGGVAVGGMAGAALSGVFPPAAPFFMLGGAIGGGYVGNKLYESAFVKQEQDPVIINMQANKMREAGEAVPPEVVFAALAANLPNKDAKFTDKLLKKYTGTKLFTEALADTNNIPKLAAMMNNVAIDDAIRAQTGMPRDPNSPLKTVAEQYAEMINSGQMKPQNMLNAGEGMFVMSAAMNNHSYNVDVPVTPETRQNSVGRTA